jgi:hypothetical protein
VAPQKAHLMLNCAPEHPEDACLRALAPWRGLCGGLEVFGQVSDISGLGFRLHVGQRRQEVMRFVPLPCI